jgi:hypothetical protein
MKSSNDEGDNQARPRPAKPGRLPRVGEIKEDLMPNRIDRHEVQRLLAEERAQLVEVLPAAGFEDEHLPRARVAPP